MGSKYVVRTREVRFFPLESVPYTEYRVNNIIELLKVLFNKRKYLIYMTKYYF